MKAVRGQFVFYGWIIVAAQFITAAVAVPARFVFSIFYIAIIEDFGWSRASTAGAFSLHMLLYGISSPIVGGLIDRLGPRKMMPLGAITLASGLFLASRINSIWQLYLVYGIVVAWGASSLGFVSNNTILSRWFVRRRATAIGMAVAGIGVGTLLASPAVQWLILRFGWRIAFLSLAAVVTTILVPLTTLVHREGPEELGLLPDGLQPATETAESSGDGDGGDIDNAADRVAARNWTLGKALRSYRFWLVFLATLLAGLSRSSMITHQVAHVVDVGYSKMLAATIFGLMALISSGGNIMAGYLSDRRGRELTYTLGGALATIGIFTLMSITDAEHPGMLYAYAVLYGLGYGAHAPVNASLQADMFRGPHFGSIHGFIVTGYGIGSAIGPWLSGLIFDVAGSYRIAFSVASVAIALTCLCLWIAAPRREFARQRLTK
jgi:MFS family permease